MKLTLVTLNLIPPLGIGRFSNSGTPLVWGGWKGEVLVLGRGGFSGWWFAARTQAAAGVAAAVVSRFCFMHLCAFTMVVFALALLPVMPHCFFQGCGDQVQTFSPQMQDVSDVCDAYLAVQ